MTPNEKAKNEQYEQSVRIITAFFAAVVGFGLKHILDGEGHAFITEHKWAFFIVTTLLFLRFLLGSANHLWVEHVRPRPEGSTYGSAKYLIFKDVSFLLIFGYLAANMCYANNSLQFYFLGMCLVFAALIWSIIDRLLKSSSGKWWKYWMYLNLTHFAAFVVAWIMAWNRLGVPKFATWSWPWPLDLLVLATMVIFAIDYLLQLSQVEQVDKL